MQLSTACYIIQATHFLSLCLNVMPTWRCQPKVICTLFWKFVKCYLKLIVVIYTVHHSIFFLYWYVSLLVKFNAMSWWFWLLYLCQWYTIYIFYYLSDPTNAIEKRLKNLDNSNTSLKLMIQSICRLMFVIGKLIRWHLNVIYEFFLTGT